MTKNDTCGLEIIAQEKSCRLYVFIKSKGNLILLSMYKNKYILRHLAKPKVDVSVE